MSDQPDDDTQQDDAMPDVSFGPVGTPLPNWRDPSYAGLGDDADDDEVVPFPPDVAAMLGFDPTEPDPEK